MALVKVEDRVIEYTYKQFTLLDGKSFFSTCVRHNRPCILREMAKKWNMTDENFDLLDVIGGDSRLFYHHTSIHDLELNNASLRVGYSFKHSNLLQGKYSKFLDIIEHEIYPGKAVIKDSL